MSSTHSEKQSSSLPIASSGNCNGISPSSFTNIWAEVDRNYNRGAALRPGFARGPSQIEDSFMWSSSFLNSDAAIGSGISGYNENLPNAGGSGVLIDPKQFPNEGLNTNHALRSTVNPTDSFDLFNVPFIDNNGRNGICCPPNQLFENTNNGVYIGNEYVPDVDLGHANEDENNDLYIGQSTIDDDFIWKAGFCQRLNAQQSMISTTGYAAEAVLPNSQAPSTSEASDVDWQHTQWPNTDENDILTLPRKKKHSKKLLPHKNLYIIHNDKYVCWYKGPAKPERCFAKSANLRYLYRHLRIHALKEREMDLPQEERVACNGIPEEMLYIDVSCPFKKVADQNKCRFFRETGTRWKVRTLERWENVMNRHKAAYHDSGDDLCASLDEKN
ncbi:hypothetical protein Clacol_000174 [Clathrus columnatus]|uniref:Uncharacterized protein n=1 Tax=Clathrus columnatus TaxID=1419009 RepID=A0AAV4ZWD0_9AGAM|nr:hypothetical protein Clacol_000174 [Clathrus columnatus]